MCFTQSFTVTDDFFRGLRSNAITWWTKVTEIRESDDCQTFKCSDVGADGSGGGFIGRCDVRLSTTIINHLAHITKNESGIRFLLLCRREKTGIVSRSNILNLSHAYPGCKLTDRDFFCHVGLV